MLSVSLSSRNRARWAVARFSEPKLCLQPKPHRGVSSLRSGRSAFASLSIPPVVGGMAGFSWQPLSPITECQVASVENVNTLVATPTLQESSWSKIQKSMSRALRLLRRVIKLTFALAPVAAFYPIQRLLSRRNPADDAHQILVSSRNEAPVEGVLGWYLELCLWCVEYSGAAVIKFMQWAGSRPDMFGSEFCNIFSRLQDDTRPHSWKHTERVMREAYGGDWRKRIELKEIIGSGCIGQVYRGVVKDRHGKDLEVAVKVIHPNTEQDIEADLDLMRFAIKFLQMLPFGIFGKMKWLNFEGIIEEMAGKLTMQLDCRIEANNLLRFNKHFADDSIVSFPQLIEGYPPTKNVLIETFCEGVPVLQFARENHEDKKLLTEMAVSAIEVVCKMIFQDNFMHGDLHPGNVLVSPDHKFVLLDLGIVNEYSEEDHDLIVDVLSAFIYKKGREAGRLMIDDSNSKFLAASEAQNFARNEEEYLDKIEAMTIKASTKGYLMEHLGSYITYICNAASDHHVMVNPAFISAALAVKVEEGIALALDPSITVAKVAIPIIKQVQVDKGMRTIKSSFLSRLFPKGTMTEEDGKNRI